MKPLTFAALFALLHVSPQAFGESAPAPVAVYVSVDGENSPRAMDAMKREVETLTQRIGYNLNWRNPADAAPGEVFSDIVVVKLRGKCHMDGIQLIFSELGPETENAALGWTKVVDGVVLPFSELDCNRIRRSIAPLTIGASKDEREALLGRAMGRVLGHELFHIFAKTMDHGHSGVAKTSHTRYDLVAERFEFDAADSKRLQRR